MHPASLSRRLLALLLPVAALALLLLLLAAAPQAALAQPAEPVQQEPNAIPPEYAALRLNEFMASNQTTLEDPDDPGQFPDWIEIYNPGLGPVDLNGKVALTDEASGNPARNPITSTLIVPAQGYLVLYADNDPQQGPEHLSFALSAAGEELGLFYIGGATPEAIDVRPFGAQTTDVSEGRRPDGSGTWGALPAPTPGESNDLNPPAILGVTRLVEIPQAGNPVTVTAAVTDNGPVAVTLNYTTSNGSTGSQAMTLVGPGSYQGLISGQLDGVFVEYWVEVVDGDANQRLSRHFVYLVGYQPPNLVINEVVAENFTQVEDLDDPGDYPDWMEIYNAGAAPVPLKGLTLSDNPREPDKYTIKQEITLAPAQFLLVYLDDDPSQANLLRLHTNFRLDKTGEFIGIFGPRGSALIDGFSFGPQVDNVAIGYYPDGTGTRRELLCTSPGAPNIACDPAAHLPVARTP